MILRIIIICTVYILLCGCLQQEAKVHNKFDHLIAQKYDSSVKLTTPNSKLIAACNTRDDTCIYQFTDWHYPADTTLITLYFEKLKGTPAVLTSYIAAPIGLSMDLDSLFDTGDIDSLNVKLNPMISRDNLDQIHLKLFTHSVPIEKNIRLNLKDK